MTGAELIYHPGDRCPGHATIKQANDGTCPIYEGRSCPTCGQWVRPPLPVCDCGHLELSHDMNAKGVRTACFHIEGPRGKRCPCTAFERG